MNGMAIAAQEFGTVLGFGLSMWAIWRIQDFCDTMTAFARSIFYRSKK